MTTSTNRRHWRLGLSIAGIAAAAFGGPTSAQAGQAGGGGVTVYADINYRGQSVTFRDDTPNLASAGWNDAISSIRMPNGETWEICQDRDYGRSCQQLTGNVADLRTMGWNDRVSSLRRIDTTGVRDRQRSWNAYTGSGVTLYVSPNFGGQSTLLRGATPNLVPYKINDKVSSIRITSGETWEVCQDSNYGGQCQMLSASVADMRTMGWNDRISSLRPVSDAGFGDRQPANVWQTNPDQGLIFFDQSGFTGKSAVVRAGTPNVGFSARQGSVQVRGGGGWELCDSSGSCVTIHQDVADVSRLGLKGRITLARPVNSNPYRRNHDDD
jgi:beta/gamma crystallin